ncbi:hypothetical protein ABZP36_035608, partial [Zizania latifolia]
MRCRGCGDGVGREAAVWCGSLRCSRGTVYSQGIENLDLSKEDLVKLVLEKDVLLKSKDEEINEMKDKVLRSYAEMENVIARTKRESENSKKYAVQNFSKSLLDVADNLTRASSVVKESFLKIDTSEDSTGAVLLLKTLLEGVDMTDKQLAEVFKKFGVEKFDPLNEKFDPSRHYAIFQIPDPSKPSGTVASVVKADYYAHPEHYMPVFHERIAPYASVIVNCMYWERRFPRLLSIDRFQQLMKNGCWLLFSI